MIGLFAAHNHAPVVPSHPQRIQSALLHILYKLHISLCIMLCVLYLHCATQFWGWRRALHEWMRQYISSDLALCTCRAAREPDAAAVVDWSQLKLGAAAAGRVHELQPYGVLYDLDAHPDLVGLITTAQVAACSHTLCMHIKVAARDLASTGCR